MKIKPIEALEMLKNAWMRFKIALVLLPLIITACQKETLPTWKVSSNGKTAVLTSDTRPVCTVGAYREIQTGKFNSYKTTGEPALVEGFRYDLEIDATTPNDFLKLLLDPQNSENFLARTSNFQRRGFDMALLKAFVKTTGYTNDKIVWYSDAALGSNATNQTFIFGTPVKMSKVNFEYVPGSGMEYGDQVRNVICFETVAGQVLMNIPFAFVMTSDKNPNFTPGLSNFRIAESVTAISYTNYNEQIKITQ